MKRALIGSLIACCLLTSSCSWFERRDAQTRIDAMMEGWRTGGTSSGGDMQEAICMWYQGTRFIADDLLLAEARDDFDAWRRQKGLYGHIESWEITSMAREDGSDPPALIVSIDIDGDTYGMRVMDREPIEWVN